MDTESFIKQVLQVAADIAQEEAHRLEDSCLRSQENDNGMAMAHYSIQAKTARRIERLLRDTKPNDFDKLRTLIAKQNLPARLYYTHTEVTVGSQVTVEPYDHKPDIGIVQSITPGHSMDLLYDSGYSGRVYFSNTRILDVKPTV